MFPCFSSLPTGLSQRQAWSLPNTLSHRTKYTLHTCSLFVYYKSEPLPLLRLCAPANWTIRGRHSSGLHHLCLSKSQPSSLLVATAFPELTMCWTHSTPQRIIWCNPHSTFYRQESKAEKGHTAGVWDGARTRSQVCEFMPRALHHLALYTFLESSLSWKALPNVTCGFDRSLFKTGE